MYVLFGTYSLGSFYSTKTGRTKKPTGKGRVYVLRFTLECGTVVHKVGMCHSPRSTDRMMEVLSGFHKTFRYIPMCKLRRDREYGVPLLVEKHLHELLSDLKYKFDKKFDGSTEFFSGLDEDMLLDYIDNFVETDLLQGKDSMPIKEYDAICATTRITNDTEIHTDELQF